MRPCGSGARQIRETSARWRCRRCRSRCRSWPPGNWYGRRENQRRRIPRRAASHFFDARPVRLPPGGAPGRPRPQVGVCLEKRAVPGPAHAGTLQRTGRRRTARFAEPSRPRFACRPGRRAAGPTRALPGPGDRAAAVCVRPAGRAAAASRHAPCSRSRRPGGRGLRSSRPPGGEAGTHLATGPGDRAAAVCVRPAGRAAAASRHAPCSRSRRPGDRSLRSSRPPGTEAGTRLAPGPGDRATAVCVRSGRRAPRPARTLPQVPETGRPRFASVPPAGRRQRAGTRLAPGPGDRATAVCVRSGRQAAAASRHAPCSRSRRPGDRGLRSSRRPGGEAGTHLATGPGDRAAAVCVRPAGRAAAASRHAPCSRSRRPGDRGLRSFRPPGGEAGTHLASVPGDRATAVCVRSGRRAARPARALPQVPETGRPRFAFVPPAGRRGRHAPCFGSRGPGSRDEAPAR